MGTLPDLTDRVALVTGGVARHRRGRWRIALAAAGADVAVNYRERAGGGERRGGSGPNAGRRAVTVGADVSEATRSPP